ncbi:MAG: hypothetical protein R3D26_24115, partial [Cyanobacteriota/Melainabacteria group bacterium]
MEAASMKENSVVYRSSSHDFLQLKNLILDISLGEIFAPLSDYRTIDLTKVALQIYHKNFFRQG